MWGPVFEVDLVSQACHPSFFKMLRQGTVHVQGLPWGCSSGSVPITAKRKGRCGNSVSYSLLLVYEGNALDLMEGLMPESERREDY